MNPLIPRRLRAGDEIRILGLSRSLGSVLQGGDLGEEDVAFAVGRLESLGLKVSFGEHVHECNEHLTATPEHRAEDYHQALEDPSVKAILAVVGGMGAVQLLDLLDYALIAARPKILCGYSDVTPLWNAIGRRSGLVTYYGPNFTSFMMRSGFDYSLEAFRRALFEEAGFELQPSESWSDDPWALDQENREWIKNDGYWPIQAGVASGRIVGGTYHGLNLLQGSRFLPSLVDSVLFLEMPASGKATLMDLDAGLRALSWQPGFELVRGIVIGRYARGGRVTRDKLASLLGEIPQLAHLPVIANAGFGHTTPTVTIPLGGQCRIQATDKDCRIGIIGQGG